MEKLKNKKLWLLIACIIVVIVLIILFIPSLKTDGMRNDASIKFYYKVHTKNGWSKWSYNGIISGNLKDPIDGIKFKNNSLTSGKVYIKTNTNKKWNSVDCTEKETCLYKNNINGIKASMLGMIDKKYDIYYRVHTKKDGWFTWTSNGIKAGSSNNSVDGIQIKIVPKNAYLKEYLKDYFGNINKINDTNTILDE